MNFKISATSININVLHYESKVCHRDLNNISTKYMYIYIFIRVCSIYFVCDKYFRHFCNFIFWTDNSFFFFFFYKMTDILLSDIVTLFIIIIIIIKDSPKANFYE